MRVVSLLCALLLAAAIGCGRYGSPRRPKPEAQVAPQSEASQPAPTDSEREERKKPSADEQKKPSAEGSPGAY